ncbi:ABC transporter substrate-binding protein [Reinekea marinisedimentorum]|uniref:NitT/TauT family transport system substrate-binding protein n=1 Tax=Reinekea marinisedimentorum TaxID=230495 RepID=A0A4R3HWB4_9GAMM|nr:ABC transporter substrate-binding protein [Reinekea marinisedimentorum]TCS35669.1 NitT/TauT family transport system substrate-binding protein [Reinekea marinisedimentorum]
MLRFISKLAVVPAVLASTIAMAEVKVPFTLDWKFEGPSAPYFLAIDNGHFAAEDLSVEISPGQGSLDAIPKVATGAYPVGFADINSLVKFLDQNPGAPVTAVMVIYDKPPFAIVGRKSQGISSVADLEGSVLGAPPPDGAWAQFPVFAIENNLDMSKIKVEPVGFPTREPMLAEGKVDSVTGYSFSSYLNLVRLGVPEEDLTTLLMADYGLALYGNVIIANTDYAEENPEVITGFLRAIAKGVIDANADPEAGAKAVIARNPAGDVELEAWRLKLAMQDSILTDYVMENGLGDIDQARFAKALEQIAITYEFKNTPDASKIFTSAYLPEDSALTME